MIFKSIFLTCVTIQLLIFIQKYGNLTKFIFCKFYGKLGNSSKKKIYMVKAVRSRQTCEVATRDSSYQQFLSHDLRKHVAANLLDKDLRSRQGMTAI